LSDLRRVLRVSSRSKGPLYYYITDRKQLRRGLLLQSIRRNVAAGVHFVQIREKDLNDGELFDLTRRAVAMVRHTRCRVLVNGRADVALAAGAHGIHLPSTGLNVADIRSWAPASFIIGRSVHSLREARAAAADGADYLLLGPVFPTESKLKYGNPLGLGRFRRIADQVRIPVFGLGGIAPEFIPQVIQAGAAGIAGISLFQVHFTQWRRAQERRQTGPAPGRGRAPRGA
jgi:thiamine-phosphate diphosphorylase